MFSFAPSEEQKTLVDSVRRFAARELRAHAREATEVSQVTGAVEMLQAEHRGELADQVLLEALPRFERNFILATKAAAVLARRGSPQEAERTLRGLLDQPADNAQRIAAYAERAMGRHR